VSLRNLARPAAVPSGAALSGLGTARGSAQMLVAHAVVAVVTLTHNWTAFGHFFTTVQAPALTGVLAALTIALGLGGFSTIRRATI
jgi:hypothetical protein